MGPGDPEGVPKTWSSMWESHPNLMWTLWILSEAVGPAVGTTDIQAHNDLWTTLMARKCRLAARRLGECQEAYPMEEGGPVCADFGAP